MKILFITPRFPYPPIKGDRLRTYHFIKALSKKGHEITLLTFIETKDENKYIKEMLVYCKSVEVVLLPKWESYSKMALTIFSSMPFQVGYYLSSEMKKKLKQLVLENNYDFLYFSIMRMVPYAKMFNNIPLVIDYIDALSLNMERRFLKEKGYLKKCLFFLEWKKTLKYERKYANIFKNIIVTSKVDKEYLNCPNIEVIPNGVDCEYFCPHEQETDIDLIFTGNMGYFPNEDAICYFCKDILPLIKVSKPEIKLYIVGASPSKKVSKLADQKNIFVTGYVDEIKTYLNRSQVVVCPMRSGSGIQNKILEAMACGIPVVATSYAIGGIKVNPGNEIALASDSKEFSEKVLLLLDNKQLCNKIADNALKFVKDNYNWENSGRTLDEILTA